MDDEDTADFLFLPVSDASLTDIDRRGSHWSLLLVDRSHRESRPVAYHYDSARAYNDRPAARLAARLGAILERPGMASSGTIMIAGSLWWTARESWRANWRKDGGKAC